MDGFLDFTFGENDENIGKQSKRFKGETGRSYRASLVWFTDYKEDGTPADTANIKFTGCERIYKDGVGYVMIDSSNRVAMLDLLKEQPKQQIATVLCIWPCAKDGELDVASYKNGKGWKVQPWTHSPDKYKTVGQNNKRFPLTKHDLTINCIDGKYQKMTFTPEGESLLLKYLEAKNEDLRAVGRKILGEARQVAGDIHNVLARRYTVDEVREKLGGEPSSPTGNHASKDVDSMLDDIGI
jgi:hypothetical protein